MWRAATFVAVMADVLVERRKLVYGGKVLLTPAAARGSAGAEGVELAEKHGGSSRAGSRIGQPAYHTATPPRRSCAISPSRRLDYFVTGWNCRRHAYGVGEVLKVARRVKIIATEPAGAALSGKEWQPHEIRDGPGRVPAVLNRKIADEIVLIDDVLARAPSRTGAEGRHLRGISSGATLAAAQK